MLDGNDKSGLQHVPQLHTTALTQKAKALQMSDVKMFCIDDQK